MFYLLYIYEWLVGLLITLAAGYSPDERLSRTTKGHRSASDGGTS